MHNAVSLVNDLSAEELLIITKSVVHYQPVMKVSRPVSVSRPIFSGLGLGLEHIFVVLVLVSRCCGLGLVRSKLVSRPACFLIHHANLLAVF